MKISPHNSLISPPLRIAQVIAGRLSSLFLILLPAPAAMLRQRVALHVAPRHRPAQRVLFRMHRMPIQAYLLTLRRAGTPRPHVLPLGHHQLRLAAVHRLHPHADPLPKRHDVRLPLCAPRQGRTMATPHERIKYKTVPHDLLGFTPLLLKL